jgi:hypothetical protein
MASATPVAAADKVTYTIKLYVKDTDTTWKRIGDSVSPNGIQFAISATALVTP